MSVETLTALTVTKRWPTSRIFQRKIQRKLKKLKSIFEWYIKDELFIVFFWSAFVEDVLRVEHFKRLTMIELYEIENIIEHLPSARWGIGPA